MSPGCVSLTDVAEGRPVLLRAPLDDKLGAPPAWGGGGVGGALGSCQPSARLGSFQSLNFAAVMLFSS